MGNIFYFFLYFYFLTVLLDICYKSQEKVEESKGHIFTQKQFPQTADDLQLGAWQKSIV